jgi:hypothetical protein
MTTRNRSPLRIVVDAAQAMVDLEAEYRYAG